MLLPIAVHVELVETSKGDEAAEA